jgi:hypothetical protein
LLVFTAQLGYLALRTEAPDCACLGQWKAYWSARESNWWGIARNTMMLVCLALSLWIAPAPRIRPA